MDTLRTKLKNISTQLQNSHPCENLLCPTCQRLTQTLQPGFLQQMFGILGGPHRKIGVASLHFCVVFGDPRVYVGNEDIELTFAGDASVVGNLGLKPSDFEVDIGSICNSEQRRHGRRWWWCDGVLDELLD
jgi:hypothetical protein